MTSDETPVGEQSLPECRIPATLTPEGLLQFRVSKDQAEQVYQQVKEEYDSVSEGEFVSVRFVMGRNAYSDAVNGLEKLEERLPQVGIKHVHLAQDPAYALTVVVDADQIASTNRSNAEALEDSSEGDLYSQEFKISQKAAILVIRQLEAAFDGAQDPVEEIDMQQIREQVT